MKKNLTALVVSVLALTLFADDIIKQDFETPEFFAQLSVNLYTLGEPDIRGKWYAVKSEGISTEQAYSGEHSFKLSYNVTPEGQAKPPIPAVGFYKLQNGGSYEMEFWFYREPGCNCIFNIIMRGADNKPVYPNTFGAWDKNRQWCYFDGKAKKYVRTGKPVPAEEWTRVLLRFDAEKAVIETYIGDADQLNLLCSNPYDLTLRLDALWINADNQSEPGASFYFDDFRFANLRPLEEATTPKAQTEDVETVVEP